MFFSVFVVCSQREQCNKNVYFVYLYYQLFCGSWSFSSRSLHTVNSQVTTQFNYNFSCCGAVDSAAAACRSLWLAVQTNLWLLMQGKISMWAYIQGNKKRQAIGYSELVWRMKMIWISIWAELLLRFQMNTSCHLWIHTTETDI